MNYLVIEGYKDAAEKFSREANVVPVGELAAIEERMQVRNAIQRGDIPTAIDKINELDPELLDSHPRISFRLQQQHLIELVRSGDIYTALTFAQEELAPRAGAHPEFLRDLERTMTLLVFNDSTTTSTSTGNGASSTNSSGGTLQKHRELSDSAHRIKVANEVNAALLAIQSQENESKLPILLRLLHRLQENLALKLSFPRLVDFTTGQFDPPLPPSSSNTFGNLLDQ